MQGIPARGQGQGRIGLEDDFRRPGIIVGRQAAQGRSSQGWIPDQGLQGRRQLGISRSQQGGDGVSAEGHLRLFIQEQPAHPGQGFGIAEDHRQGMDAGAHLRVRT